MASPSETASIVMAAGRGSRMKAYDGNKTLLPLVPGNSPFEGTTPILVHILNTLPQGPKALIVHHCTDDVKAATRSFNPVYCFQPELNGTGGAILAARAFIEAQTTETITITMGDVPFVKAETYERLIARLSDHDMVVLGFQPVDKKRYGILETEGDLVKKITEWKYWRDYPEERQAALTICNAGIYAARRDVLAKYLPVLASRPQIVQKERNGKLVDIEEFFITDIVEYMNADGLSVGCALATDESETMGIDDPDALKRAQEHYKLTYL